MERIFTILCTLIPFVVTLAVSRADNDFVRPANTSLVLNSSLTPADNVTWYHRGEKISSGDEKYKLVDASLQIEVGHETSGQYKCMVHSSSETFTVHASPYVKLQKESKNVMEGDPFQVECHAWGSLPLTVTWTLKGIPVVADGHRIVFKNSSSSSHVLENATLRIQSVAFEDGGDYVCVAENDYGNATATITVHVISMMAAVWPFLGICAEVAILCTIIFIYEKRRNKRLEEEASREEADQLNAVDTKQNPDVRQRK